MSNKGITFEIIEHIGVIGKRTDYYKIVWTKEVNIVAWNGGAPKIDIREWDTDHIKMSRGITLTEEEAKALYEALKGRYE